MSNAADTIAEKTTRERRRRRRVVVCAFENREEGKEEEGEDNVGSVTGGTGQRGDGEEEATAEEQTATMDYRAFRAKLVASERAEVVSEDTEATCAAESERWMYEVREVPTSVRILYITYSLSLSRR